MSFILDALRKSETERQQKGSAEFAGVPTSERREKPPRWLWVLGALLAINLVVLLGLLLRPDTQPTLSAAATPTDAAAIPAETAAIPDPGTSREADFSEQVAAARQNAPPRDERRPAAAESAPPETRPSPAPSTSAIALPTIHELVASGAISVPELHVDMHVYSEASDDRFVFINMNKHVEGSRLAEGPLIREITPEGVVLVLDGKTFLLPRD